MFKPIGIINTPFTSLEGMPIQPVGAPTTIGKITVHEEYAEGLKDLEGFSHVYLIYQFHECKAEKLIVKPFMDTATRGVFSTRAPVRPNHIGLSIVELTEIKGSTITVKGIDILNGTPLMDIKPYIAKFDLVKSSKSGWMKAASEEILNKRSDARFA